MSYFVPQRGKYAFTSNDLQKFGTQSITFTITATVESSASDGDRQLGNNVDINIGICVNVNGQSSCPEETDESTGVMSFTFELNLVDPCDIAEFSIDPSIINPSIYYGVYTDNIEMVTSLSQSLVTSSHPSPLCPDIVLDVVNANGSPLDGIIFSYNSTAD